MSPSYIAILFLIYSFDINEVLCSSPSTLIPKNITTIISTTTIYATTTFTNSFTNSNKITSGKITFLIIGILCIIGIITSGYYFYQQSQIIITNTNHKSSTEMIHLKKPNNTNTNQQNENPTAKHDTNITIQSGSE
eukprot:271992_1